jgi:hypothetical protein
MHKVKEFLRGFGLPSILESIGELCGEVWVVGDVSGGGREGGHGLD